MFQTDLSNLARSWVLRVWFVLTVLVAMVTMLDHGDPRATAQKPGGAVLAALLHPIDTTSGEASTLRELLKFYIVIWVSFIIVLTAGTISAELGVVADSVLCRGISRWQYFLGKWTARLVAVLGVYLLVAVPCGLILWLSSGLTSHPNEQVAQAEFNSAEVVQPPDPIELHRPLTLSGVALALTQVAALLAFVVTCGVALSASFDSTVISIAVGWVTIYGTGLILSILDVSRFSPARLIRELPDVLNGHLSATDLTWSIGGWLALTLAVFITSGVCFARRDV